MADETPPTGRRSPVGEPVIRGDAAIAGEHATEAVAFDPDDPESVRTAVETVRRFADDAERGRPRAGGSEDDALEMLRGAAACATLVRAEGSYKAACERAGETVTVSFVRKWARVHDLPRAIRIHVARGDIVPTAAKHIARVTGQDRYDLAWAALDHGLTVRELRSVVGDIDGAVTAADALADRDIELGATELTLAPGVYRELRRRAAIEGQAPGALVSEALRARFGNDTDRA